MRIVDMNTAAFNILNNIFIANFGFDFESVLPEVRSYNLLGHKIGLRPRHLVKLLFDIEDKFNILIPQHYIADGLFTTFDKIEQIIIDELKGY
jgi:peptide maturation system acyl carrier-related protein